MTRKEALRIARAILDTPKGEPVSFGLLLRALQHRQGDAYLFEGGVPSRLQIWPFVRVGDVIEVDSTGSVRPFAGCMAVVARDAGSEEHPYPTVEPVIVFETSDRRLWCDGRSGPAFPLDRARMLGVVTRHTARVKGRSGEIRTLSREEGLPYFYTSQYCERWLAGSPQKETSL